MRTRRYIRAMLVAVLMCMAAYGVSASAAPARGGWHGGGSHGGGWHGGGWHGGGWHGGGWRGGGWRTSVYIGAPWYGGYYGGVGWGSGWGWGTGWGFGYPYATFSYAYPAPYVAPAVVAPVADPAPRVQGPAPQSYWYYCRPADAYYPYVRQCPQGWERVPVTPSTAARSGQH